MQNCGEGRDALELPKKMLKEGVEPNPMTFVGILNTCADVAALKEGKRVHQRIIEDGHESDVSVANSLIDMYGKCVSIEDAELFFENMVTRIVASWSAMILGYVKCGEGRQALVLELSQRMLKEGFEPNPVTCMGILNACATVASLEDGRHAHEQIIQKDYEPNVYVANSLIDVYAKCGSLHDGHRMFKKL